MIAPYIKKLVDHCHARGVIFELHSCGCTESMIDLISSIGIDMWRPQPMNDIRQDALKTVHWTVFARRYARRRARAVLVPDGAPGPAFL